MVDSIGSEAAVFDYLVPGAKPGRAGTVWSVGPLQPVAAGVLTPFSYSVLSELVGRGWYVYYDRLGFAPTPRSRLVRRYNGRAYLNLSISAALDAERAGVEPVTLRVNDRPLPLAEVEKGGLLAGFRLGRARKKIDDVLTQMNAEMDAVTEKARNWYIKTQGLRWSQAEVLQIMEEIERVGSESMATYLAARHNLESLYAHLLTELNREHTLDQSLLLINNALCDMQTLVEWELANAVIALSETLQEPEQIAWLKAGDGHTWQATMPGKLAQSRFAAFMDDYGHRALHEGELALPRWAEDPNIVMRGLLVCVEHPTRHPAPLPKAGALHKVVEALPTGQRRQGEQMMEKIRTLHRLQSRALHALAYIGAGTRLWALAAAREAMADGRLQAEQEVFCFELEEIKEMMTGEWNISSLDEIRATYTQRSAEVEAWRGLDAPEILVDDLEGRPVQEGLPGVAGHAAGPLRRWGETKKNGCSGAILASEVFDGGWALALPLAVGFVSKNGSPLDPFVAAARAWHHPVMVGLGSRYSGLVEGAHTILDIHPESVSVEQ
jgi:rifampicin phosphotransferase